MDKEKIIFKELNEWVYNDVNQAGDKLIIIDASDLPEIMENIKSKLEQSKLDGEDTHDNLNKEIEKIILAAKDFKTHHNIPYDNNTLKNCLIELKNIIIKSNLVLMSNASSDGEVK